MFDRTTYIERRNNLKKLLKAGLVILPGNNDSPMSYKDNAFPFVQDSTFLYFFGLNTPGLIGIMDLDNDIDYIFGKEYTLDDIIWMGPQKSFKLQAQEVGIEKFLEIETLKDFLKQSKNQNILFLDQYRDDNILTLSSLLNIDPFQFKNFTSRKLAIAISKLRNIKTTEEIKEIEKAVNITRLMHLEAFKVAKPGIKEYEITAAIEKIAKEHNCLTSFHTICTKHGEILHNHSQNNVLSSGDILLLDCGARLESGYCGDMTTVIPVSGTFSNIQKEFYQLLIKMFEKAETLIKPGVKYLDVHIEVCKELTRGLIEKNILKGDVDEIVANGAHALFFPHGLGHMLGLDVHDMENFGEDIVGYGEGLEKSQLFGLKSLRLARILEEGHVFTIEPGIYFIPELIKRWENENKFTQYINYDEVKKYINLGGMRYEGDFVITKDGARRLGEKMPKSFAEVEKIKSQF